MPGIESNIATLGGSGWDINQPAINTTAALKRTRFSASGDTVTATPTPAPDAELDAESAVIASRRAKGEKQTEIALDYAKGTIEELPEMGVESAVEAG
jgi:hypothetical protein